MANLTPYQEAALSFDKHIALTANAGSGKTFVFTKRFVKILVKENIKLNQIIAITFTEKAASELYVRIAGELNKEIQNNAHNKKLHAKLVEIRNHLVSANISTIHSFCFNLLKEYSPVVGIDSNLSLIDTNLADEIKEREISLYLEQKLNRDNTNEIKNLVRICGSKLALQQQLKFGLNKIKIVNRLWDNIYSKDTSKTVSHFEDEYDKLLKIIVSPKIGSAINAISEVNKEVLYNNTENRVAIEVVHLLNKLEQIGDDYDSISYFIEIKNLIFTKSNTLLKRGYLNKAAENYKDHEQVLVDFFEVVSIFNVDEAQKNLNISLAEFGKNYLLSVLDVQDAYDGYKTANGFLDFEDLILISEKLLKNEDVRSALASKYRFIMIDEYQDTDDSQFNIFAPILDHLKQGNLFVVGDEKQSIYMFRDADLKVFDKTKGLIKTISGSEGILELPHSFRLSPRIAFFCNKVFSSLMHNPDLIFNEVPYSELVTTSDEINSGEVGLLLSNDESNLNEEELICDKILELTSSKNISFSNIAVLVRKRSSFKSLEQRLLASNIPYAIIGGRGFYEQQEIYDIHNYIQFLIDESNDAALVGILRSPFFLIPDSDLLNISLENGDSFYQKLKVYAKHHQKFLSIAATLEQHLLAQSQHDIAKLIRRVLIDTGYLSVISSQQDSEQKIANINKLINQAKHFHKKQLSGLFDFSQKLTELINLAEDEGQAQLTNDGNVVNLMTIHQAKGLEYKAVFLFNSHLRSNIETIKSRHITIDKEYGILTKLPIDNDFFTDFESAPIVKIGSYKASRQALAEVKRLMYVGMTRAEEFLYISGDISKAIPSTSFLGLLKDALGIENFDSDIEMKGKIQYMFEQNTAYEIKDIFLDFVLNIFSGNDLAQETMGEYNKPEINFNELEIKIEKINSHASNEIVSATKMNMFIQCPLKYNLSYNLGYIDLHNNFGMNEKLLFDRQDDDTILPGNIKGTLIHKVLERGITNKSEIEEYILKNVEKNLELANRNFDLASITKELCKFFESKVYKEINELDNYINEFEIYAKLNDFYIYGILDKYYNRSGLHTVIDYKTDKINEANYMSKFEYYRNQLLFYCLLINSYFGNDSDVEVKLVFIAQPELSVSQVITKQEIKSFREKVITIVKKIRNNEFEKNIAHCNVCQYSINNNCVIK